MKWGYDKQPSCVHCQTVTALETFTLERKSFGAYADHCFRSHGHLFCWGCRLFLDCQFDAPSLMLQPELCSGTLRGEHSTILVRDWNPQDAAGQSYGCNASMATSRSARQRRTSTSSMQDDRFTHKQTKKNSIASNDHIMWHHHKEKDNVVPPKKKLHCKKIIKICAYT
jgi:hypothetical protein